MLDFIEGGTSWLVLGPPGSGKSTLLGSAAEADDLNVKLFAFKPREVNSWKYRQNDIDYEIFHDPRWQPDLDKYEASGYINFKKRLWSFQEDEEYDVVLFDPLTDLFRLLSHELLKKDEAATPRDLDDSLSFYGEYKHRAYRLIELITSLASPTMARPKHVLAAMHTQPTKDEDIKGSDHADKKAQDVQFIGHVLPHMEGGAKYDLAGEFDIVLYSQVSEEFDTQTREKQSIYTVQSRGGGERHAKVALGPSLPSRELPNDFASVVEAIEEGHND